MKFHFLSGLPRSGTTLLASILRQNPRFTSHVESPVGRAFSALHNNLGAQNEASIYITDDARARMLRGLFENFYAGCGAEVVFDNNRRWTANIDLIAKLFPDARVICCVRHPAAIVDSLERVAAENPYMPGATFGAVSNLTIGQRVNQYMKADGVVGYALDAVRSAFYGPSQSRLLLVHYDGLASNPKDVLEMIHRFTHEPDFTYNFDDIQQLPDIDEFDRRLGMPGLHRLKSSVTYERRKSVLPPDLISMLPKPFWD